MSTPRLVVFLALVLAAAAQAQSSAKEPDCSDANALGQQGMNQCAYAVLDIHDRELNRLYKQLARQQDADSARQLQAAQRAWLQFRDLECVFESPDAAGSLGPQEKAECMTALTKERIADIKRSLR